MLSGLVEFISDFFTENSIYFLKHTNFLVYILLVQGIFEITEAIRYCTLIVLLKLIGDIFRHYSSQKICEHS